MSLLMEERSKVTAKGQTTVPKAVRQTLGLRSGDQIAYLVDDSGTVSLVRLEEEADVSAMDSFLAFLSNDIRQRPQAVAAMSDETVARLRSLTEGVEVDLEGDFANATAI